MKPFFTFTVCMITSMMLGLASCKELGLGEPDGACDAGKETVNHFLDLYNGFEIEKGSYPLPKGNYVFYQDFGDTIKFFTYQPQVNICTKEHFHVDFSVILEKTLPPSFKIYGEVNWSALFPSAKVTLLKSGTDAPIPYSGSAEAGLKQVYGDKPAEADSYLTIQFESQGSQLKNIAYLREHIRSMKIGYTYSKHAR